MPHWNTLTSICTLEEAVMFLKANKNKLDELYQSNQARYTQKDSNGNSLHDVWFDYYRIYPSLAGKIAYIYYRFDVSDDGFVRSVVSDRGEYSKDREGYIQTAKNMILRDSIHPNKHIKIIDEYKNLISSHTNIQARKDFVERLIKAVCKRFGLPLNGIIFSNEAQNIYGSYNSITQNININAVNLGNLRETLKTIFHEIRHFYIDIHYNPNKIANLSILKQYMHWSNQFYISSIYTDDLFKDFSKQCDVMDSANVGCVINNNQNAYEIQPNERDPRYVATQIVTILP